MPFAVSHSLLFGLSALVALLPATVYALSPRGAAPERIGAAFWVLGAVALCGVVAWTAAQFAAGWRTGFAPSLWLIIAVTLALYAVTAALSHDMRRLAGPLLVYLALLAVPAVLWSGEPERPLPAPVGAWMSAHIVAAVLAYGLTTLAAVAGFGVLVREAALKRKMPSGGTFSARLPAVVDGERLQARLLTAAAALLALALASGVGAQYVETGALLPLTHKIVLALLAFALVIVMLLLHSRFGVGGRRLARLLLLAYLALAFAYPGVKFVTDVLAAAN